MIPTKPREEKGPDRNSPRWKQYYLTLYPKDFNGSTSVSYTHLTLPTISSV